MSNRLKLPHLYGTDGQVLGPRLVRNKITNAVLLCCYGPCTENGDERYKIVTPHPEKARDTLTRIYCGPGHRDQDRDEKGLGPIELPI